MYNVDVFHQIDRTLITTSIIPDRPGLSIPPLTPSLFGMSSGQEMIPSHHVCVLPDMSHACPRFSSQDQVYLSSTLAILTE